MVEVEESKVEDADDWVWKKEKKDKKKKGPEKNAAEKRVKEMIKA